MPEIARFYGIIIQMFWNDHAPPHFHALYGDDEAVIAVRTLALMRGHLPTRAMKLVLEWANLHRDELEEDWKLCQSRQTPKKIDPLA